MRIEITVYNDEGEQHSVSGPIFDEAGRYSDAVDYYLFTEQSVKYLRAMQSLIYGYEKEIWQTLAEVSYT